MKKEEATEYVQDILKMDKNRIMNLLLRGAQIEYENCDNSFNSRARYSTCNGKRKVTICANFLNSFEDLKEAITHEMVHLYDDLYWKCNFQDPNELACTEIRAATFAECANENNIEDKKKCVEGVAHAAVRLSKLERNNVRDMMATCFTDNVEWTFNRSTFANNRS